MNEDDGVQKMIGVKAIGLEDLHLRHMHIAVGEILPATRFRGPPLEIQALEGFVDFITPESKKV